MFDTPNHYNTGILISQHSRVAQLKCWIMACKGEHKSEATFISKGVKVMDEW